MNESHSDGGGTKGRPGKYPRCAHCGFSAGHAERCPEDGMWLPGTRRGPNRPGEYIRNHYRVPAYIGTRVAYVWPERHGGVRRIGKITGFRDQYLLIKFDDEQRGSRVLYHPTWEIEYLTDEAESNG